MPDNDLSPSPGGTLQNKMAALLKRIRDIRNTFRDSLTAENVEAYRPTYNRLSTLQDRLDEYGDQAIDLNATLATDNRIDVEALQFETDRYVREAQMYFLSKTEGSGSIHLGQTSLSAAPIKLPRLEVPKFNGDVGEWRSWCNLYKAAVHNNQTLNAVEKFRYLRTYLKGTPHALIKELDLTEGNYTVAWELLVRRYQSDRRHIFHSYNGLLDLPEAKSPPQALELLNKLREHSHALEAVGHPPAKYDGLLVAIVMRKLSDRFASRFEDYRKDRRDPDASINGITTEYPKIQEVIEFLERECILVEERVAPKKEPKVLVSTATVASPSPQKEGKKDEGRRKKGNQKTQHSGYPAPDRAHDQPQTKKESIRPRESLPCPACPEKHLLMWCPQFRKRTPSERRVFVHSKGLCFNCLRKHEPGVTSCPSQNACWVCQKRHNTLLHGAKEPASNRSEAKALVSRNTAPAILLATVQIRIKASRGSKAKIVRGILDCAAQGTFVTHDCAKRIGLKIAPEIQDVSGISGTAVRTHGHAYATLFSLHHQAVAKYHRLVIVDKITNPTPSAAIAGLVRERVQGWTLADPSFDEVGPVDILIGADLYPYLLIGAPIPLGADLPVALQTTLGYVLMGAAPPAGADTQALLTCLLTTDGPTMTNLPAQMQRFWQLEEVKTATPLVEPEHPAEVSFRETTTRLDDGRFQVRIPFSRSPELLGASYQQALRRFQALERRFKKDPEFHEEYVEFMRGYMNSQFMIPAPPDAMNGPHYFMPHHGVRKDSSSTTKLRVVFDASAKSASGLSLNDIIHAGPTLLRDIKDVLLGFRCHPVVLSSDVRQMYLQVALHPEDQRYHLVLWRPDPSQPMRIYQMTTLTFGVSCSSFLSTRAIQQLALENQDRYPIAARIILEDTYVDDLVTGGKDPEWMRRAREELIALLKLAGFSLRKWISNEPSLLDDLDPSHLEVPNIWGDQHISSFAILGLQWIPLEDAFSYRISSETRPPTKRGLTSAIASIFDPNGYIAPVVFLAKTYIQRLWLLKIDWDDTIPSNLIQRWDAFLEALPSLEKVRLRRQLAPQDAPVQLLAFCDASELGYSCVVYIRSDEAPHKPQLVASKTKVAPLKRVTLPRLELCGATLLANLLAHLVERLAERYAIGSLHAWTDSTITLRWLQTPPHRLKTFVANRVSHIQESLPSVIWHHVRSAENPADCASRGILAHQLIDHPLWWHGPKWLELGPEHWAPFSDSALPAPLPELKPETSALLVREKTIELDVFAKISCWDKLIRVLAYVLRFRHHLDKKGVRSRGPLTLDELDAAERVVILKIQGDSLNLERQRIARGLECPPRIQQLHPFLDKHGLIRVGGRLSKSDLDHDQIHPWLLPHDHPLVEVLVATRHRREPNLHPGPQQLQALLAQKYWILSARKVARKVVRRCVPCFRARPRNASPLMGELPPCRVLPSPPFTNTGVDYAGPLAAKVHTLRFARPVKAYLCIFVCMATKATFIEVTEDLTTDSFLAAMSRFASRRGNPSHVYCDCGTNFVGAANELTQATAHLHAALQSHEDLANFTQKHGTTFHFNPPAAPHQGGLWEAAVKSAKTHIHRVLQGQVPTLEELRTLTVKVEAMLNSRPLTPLSDDPCDLQPLTPAHFLIGRPLQALPERHRGETFTPLKRWHRVQAMAQSIWRRWHQEYLSTLMSRRKWNKESPPLQVGDLVLLEEPNTSPLHWCLGRISAVFPGKDGHVRVASVTTASSEVKRPAVKIYPLPHSQT